MPTLESPLWMQNDTYTGAQDRTLVDNLWATDGVLNVGDLLVAQRAAGTNMSVDVASGVGVVTGDDAAAQGKYLCRHLSGPTNVALAAAPGVGLSRIDLIVLRIQDAAVIGGANNNFIFDKVTGTAASSPSAPALPASCMLLAQVAVGATVTQILNANITDMRRRAFMLNAGMAICTSTTRPTSPWAGLMAFETDTQLVKIYNGAAWKTLKNAGDVHVSAYRTSAWTSAAGSRSNMGYDTEQYDTSSNFTATGWATFTAPVDGYYHHAGRIAVGTTDAANRYIQAFMVQNGSTVGQGSTGISGASGEIIDTVWARTFHMAVGDTMQMQCFTPVAIGGQVGSDATYWTIDLVS